MSTERQKQANQRNARLSTGPRSASGKAISSQNHRIHGFSSKIAVLTEAEDREIFASRFQQYLEAHGTGKPADTFHAFAAVNAEFQYIFINRARSGFVRFARERALDQLWGSQPIPEDPDAAFELNSRLTGYAVLRDLNDSGILLKMSRYEREQIRTIDRAVQQMERNQPPESEEIDAYLRQALEDFLQNSAAAAGTRCEPGVTTTDSSNAVGTGCEPGVPTTESAPNTSDPRSTRLQACVTNDDPSPDLDQPPAGTGSQPGVSASDESLSETNPISDNSATNQPETLCKSQPEIETCPVCLHPEKEQLRYLLANPHDIHQIARDWQIPVLDLWRCRLHHIESPADHYDIVVQSVQKARLLDKTDIQPMILLEDKERPLGINFPFPEMADAA